jgi:hypothetical protein
MARCSEHPARAEGGARRAPRRSEEDWAASERQLQKLTKTLVEFRAERNRIALGQLEDLQALRSALRERLAAGCAARAAADTRLAELLETKLKGARQALLAEVRALNAPATGTARPPGAAGAAGGRNVSGVGSRVRVDGLTSDAHLNARAGTVIGPAPGGRLSVQLDGDGKIISVKSDNLWPDDERYSDSDSDSDSDSEPDEPKRPKKFPATGAALLALAAHKSRALREQLELHSAAQRANSDRLTARVVQRLDSLRLELWSIQQEATPTRACPKAGGSVPELRGANNPRVPLP